MKKITLLLSMLMASGLLLGACDNKDTSSSDPGPQPCQHVDESPADHKCDKCGATLSPCYDANHDHKCDVCGETLSQCSDGNGDHQCDVCGADLPWVESLAITNKPTAELDIGETFELTVSVTAHNGASDAFTFSIDDETVVSYDETTGKFTTLKVGTATITATSTFDLTIKDDVTITVVDKGFDPNFLTKGWTFTREYPSSLIKEFLGSGDSQIFVPTTQSGLMGNGVYYKQGTTHFDLAFGYTNSVNNYNAIMSNVYGSGLYGVGLDLTTEDNFFVDSDLTHVVRYQDMRPVFPGNTYIGLNFYKTSNLFSGSSTPTTNTDWTNADKATFATVFGAEYDVPFFTLGADYVVQAASGFVMIYDNSANYHLYDALNAALADAQSGWTYDSTAGFYTKDIDDRHYMQIGALFTLEYGNLYQVGVYTKPYTEWPTEEVNNFIGDGSTLTVPAATGTLFDVFVGTDYYGDAVMQITVTGGDMDDYAALFDESLFTVTYDSWYEQYHIVAKDCTLDIYLFQDGEDLYVQIYVIEPAEWPFDAIAAFINGRTDEVVPSVTCSFVETELWDGSLYIEVNGASIWDYVEACVDAGYNVSTVVADQYYQATSPKGTIVLRIYLGNYTDIEIEVNIVEPPQLLEEWPADQIAAALGELAGDDINILPAAEGKFEFETNSSYPNECIVTVYADAIEYATYILNLTNFGFAVLTDEGVGFEATSPTGTIHINGFDYTEEDESYFVLDIWAQPVSEYLNEFPAEEIAAFLGFATLDCPTPTGDGFKPMKPYGESYPCVDVEVVGGDLPAYLTALAEAGFTYSEKYSYDGSYTAYQKDGSGLVVYVYEKYGDVSKTNTNFVLGYENPQW